MAEQSLKDETMGIETCAPVIIPTLNRYEHFKRCFESLEKCVGAEKTDVYIGLDYPPSEKYISGWKQVDEYLHEKEKSNIFHKLVVFRREKNYGVLHENSNNAQLSEYVFKYYDRYIFSEDDNVFSPNFLVYMNTCLDYYKDDPDVFGITGYNYPLNWKTQPGATVIKQKYHVQAWGMGVWKEKWESIIPLVTSGAIYDKADYVVKHQLHRYMTDADQKDYFGTVIFDIDYLKKNNKFAVNPTDTALTLLLSVEGKYFISPVISKVRNIGFDGSGETCQNTINNPHGVHAWDYNYSLQDIDSSIDFTLIECDMQFLEQNRNLHSDFDSRSIKDKFRTRIIIYLIKYLGLNNVRAIVRCLIQMKHSIFVKRRSF